MWSKRVDREYQPRKHKWMYILWPTRKDNKEQLWPSTTTWLLWSIPSGLSVQITYIYIDMEG